MGDSEFVSDVNMKVDVKRTVLIGLGFMSAMIAWSFYNFKIPIILNGVDGIRQGILPDTPFMEIVGAFLMVLDNIIAILLQPYFGELSDRLESKYGRRTPFFIIGLPTAVICLVILPLFPQIGLFIAVIFVFNLAMAFYRTPIMSLMPDQTPKQLVSSANSFVSLMGGFGTIFGMVIPALVAIFPGGDPILEGGPHPKSYFYAQDQIGFILTGLFMVICLIIFLLKIKETPTGDKLFHLSKQPIMVDIITQKVEKLPENTSTPSKPGFFDQWMEIWKDEEKSAFWILLTVFSYQFGYNALEFSFGRFAASYLGVKESTASIVLATIPIMLIVFAIPAGRWATKYGRLKIMKLGLIILMIITGIIIIILSILRAKYIESGNLSIIDLIPIIILLSIGGIGYGFTHINALPVVWQLAPKNKIGAYTGVYYMISALGSILSPLFMGLIYMIIENMGGNQWVSLFPYFFMGLFVAFIFIKKVRKGDVEPLTKEELANLKSIYSDD